MSSDFEIAVQSGGEASTIRRPPGSAGSCASPAPSGYGFVQAPQPASQQQWTRVTPPPPPSPPVDRDAVYARRCRCSKCWTGARSRLTSAVGVSILLAVYLVLGAVMFMTLGANENSAEAARRGGQERTSADALAHYDADGRLMDKTLATVDRLWAITEDLNILYRDNWTHLARAEMRRYHEQLVEALREAMLEERYSFRQTWTLPMSLLYAITLVTTIGYGFYTPTAPLARGLTTMYSLLGIPLFLLYLSVAGERLARVINRVTCSCCCCCCSCCGDGRPGRSRRASYRPYGDVTLALEPVTYSTSNGHHALQVAQLDAKTGRRRSPTPAPHQLPLIDGAVPTADGVVVEQPPPPPPQYCCSSASLTAPRGSMPGANQLPVVVCAGLVAAFVSLAALLVVLFEPQLSFADGLHLTVNLLATLGFAGNLLPGTTVHQGGQTAGSQASLVVVSCLILAGTTLLSASFNVLTDCAGHRERAPKSDGNHAPSATYHHVPSPTR